MTAGEFHDDRLTPGIVTRDDPPPTLSGMINLELDAHGRLLYFEAIPAQLQEPAKEVKPVDWGPLFQAADLDASQFQSVEPLWTFLAASDTRLAWAGRWPGTARPLHVEAASLRGKPVAFALSGPWVKPWRMPPASATREQAVLIVLGGLFAILCMGALLLARRNLAQGRGDRRGALRLACFIFCVQMALWLCRGHFAAVDGIFGTFVLAFCTSVFYGAVVWTVYLSLEPYVRRRWPQALISWTSVLTGRFRDPIVGRDVLFGVALGLSFVLIQEIVDSVAPGSAAVPSLARPDLLLGLRSTLGSWLLHVPGSVRETLIFFLMVFLLRALLRNQWLAGGVFALVFTSLSIFGSDRPMIAGLESLLINGIVAVAVLRFGLLALAVGIFVAGVVQNMPVTANPSNWYFAGATFMLASVAVLAGWAFHTSIAGRRLWKPDLFG